MNAAPAALSQVKPRLAGLFYTITIAAGLFAEIGVRSAFRGPDALPVAGNASFYRLGELADVVMLCCYVAVTTLLYELLAPAGRQLAIMAAAFSMTGIAVLASDGLVYMAPLVLAGQDGRGAMTVAALLDLHGTAYGISLIFFGIYCMLIGCLLIRSRALPAIVGMVMMAGGASHVVANIAGLVAPDLVFPWPMRVLPLIGETMLALWLLLFGMRAGPSSPARSTSPQ